MEFLRRWHVLRRAPCLDAPVLLRENFERIVADVDFCITQAYNVTVIRRTAFLPIRNSRKGR